MAKLITLQGEGMPGDDLMGGWWTDLKKVGSSAGKVVGNITDNPLVHAGLSAASAAVGAPGAYNAIKSSANTASSMKHGYDRLARSASGPQLVKQVTPGGSGIASIISKATRSSLNAARGSMPYAAPVPPQQDNSKLLMIGGAAVLAFLLLRGKK
jgi:hypothetical protein